jgi:glycolate oxidase FAD binding subunit
MDYGPVYGAPAGRGTIGGALAANLSGPRRIKAGAARDHFLGFSAVSGRAETFKSGGRVVKNVTGYDIPKLHVGALGTLGVVVEAHLRLHPRPAEERTWVFAFPSAEAALEAALEIRDRTVVLSRCQLLTAGALRAAGETAPPEAALAVTIGSVAEAVRAQGAKVADICGREGRAAIEVPEADRWWQRVSDVTWPEHPATDLSLRIGARPTDVAKALHAVETVKPATADLRSTADVATGVLHATLSPVDARDVRGILARGRERLAALDGTCVVEHAPPPAMPGLDVWGEVGPALEAMRRLKRELDPGDVLNPGRYVGGI